MAPKLSKYYKNPLYIVAICIFILITISIFAYKSNKKNIETASGFISLVEKQRITSNNVTGLLLEFVEKKDKNKKNLQVLISEIKNFRISIPNLVFKLDDLANDQDQQFNKNVKELSNFQKQLDRLLKPIDKNDNSTLKYLNPTVINNLVVINTKQTVIFNNINTHISYKLEKGAKRAEVFFSIIIILITILLIFWGFKLIKYFRMKNKRILSELNKAKSAYELLLANSETVLVKLDQNGNIGNVSSSCLKVLGYTIEEIINKPIIYFLDTNSSSCIKDYFRSGKTEYIFTSQFIHKTINYIWVEIRIKPSENSPDEFEAALINVTEKKKLENGFLESQTKYRAVFDNMFDGFAYYKVLLDENGKTDDYMLLEVNDAFERLTGLQRENVVGKKLTEIFPGIKESRYNWIGKYDNVALNGEVVKSEHYEKHIDRWHNISAYSPMKGYFVTLFEDITQRKNDETAIRHYVSELQKNKEKIETDAKELAELNIKLSESEAELRELNANKDKFFSIIAHDLRTPFNSLIGISDLLTSQVEQLSQYEIKEYSENIYNSSTKLFNLLENLLKWAGLQSGRISKTPVPFYIDVLITSITELYRNNLADKEINLVMHLTQNLKVFADQDMIETVLRNLLSNAIKFTGRQGTITIEMNCNPKFVEVYLSDNGVGIDQNVINKLFKISEHITSPGTENEKGTGLGLILCKEFVEKNGGTIKVYSEPGKGSKFIFTVPRFGY